MFVLTSTVYKYPHKYPLTWILQQPYEIYFVSFIDEEKGSEELRGLSKVT